RTGEQQVARDQREERRKIRDHLRNLPDQLAQVAALAWRPVHLEPDGALRGMANVGRAADGRARRRAIERLAGVPRPAHLLRLGLEVASGHVEPDGVSVDEIQGTPRGDAASPGAEGDDQLQLVVDIGAVRRIGEVAAVGDDGVRRLHEEERRLTIRIVTHLARVLRVVPPPAVDAVDRKARPGALDREGWRGLDGDHVLHWAPPEAGAKRAPSAYGLPDSPRTATRYSAIARRAKTPKFMVINRTPRSLM